MARKKKAVTEEAAKAPESPDIANEETLATAPDHAVVDEAPVAPPEEDMEIQRAVTDIQAQVEVEQVVKAPSTKFSSRAYTYVGELLAQYFGRQLQGVDLASVMRHIETGKQAYVTKAPFSVKLSNESFRHNDIAQDVAIKHVALNLSRALVHAKLYGAA